MSQQKTIWVVDDIEEIIFCFTAALANQTNYRFIYVSNAKEVKALPGDIVFLDLNGTNAGAFRQCEGVHVIRMTGGFKPADLYKPFSSKEIDKLVQIIQTEGALKRAA